MRRIAIGIFAAALAAGGSAVAQEQQQPAEQQAPQRGARAQARFEELQQRLKLSPDQAEKVRAIFQEQRDNARQLRQERQNANAQESRRDRMKQMRQLREDTDKKLESVLSKDQMAEYRKFQDERRQEMRQHMRSRMKNQGTSGTGSSL